MQQKSILKTNVIEEEPNIPRIVMKWALPGLAGIVVLFTFFGSWFTVDQNEVAGVTRFGSLISTEPIQAGIHFKVPFVDDVHHIRISMDRLNIGRIDFKTMDNQFGSVEVNLTYRTGDPFKAMFKVGDMGARGIIDKVTPFVHNRTIEVFGTVSALQITDELIDLQKRILLAIQAPAMDYFGERIEDVQLTGLKYSDTFERNVEAMVQTRNQQIQAENVLKIRETEAKQAVATAEGQANASAAVADGNKRVAIANAEGAAQQVRLQADAAAYSRKVQSEAEAGAIRVIGDAQGFQLAQMVKGAGNADAFIGYLRATAAQKWDGSVPKIALNGGEKGTQPLVVLPPEAMK